MRIPYCNALLMIALTVSAATQGVISHAQDSVSEPLPPLGILFYTPATREALDEARRGGRRLQKSTVQGPAVETALRVNGMVIAKDGRKTAWVNGRTVNSGEELSDGLRVMVDESDRGLVRLDTPDKGLVKVKPGESIRSMLSEPLQPPAAMKAPVARSATGGAESEPDSLEARLDRIPADVSLRDLISVLLSEPEPEVKSDQGVSGPSTREEGDRGAGRR